MTPYETYRLASLGAGNTPEEAESDGLYGAWLAGQATAGAADTQLAVGVRGTAARECSEAGAIPASVAPALPFQAEASCPEQAANSEAGAGTLLGHASDSGVSCPPAPAKPKVRTQAEYGHLGHLEQVRRHGERKVRAWLRKGGRKPDPTFDQIMAATTGKSSAAGGKRRR